MNALDRVVVIGSSCAGKTTFAARLAHVLGQPTTDLDELFWAPHWQAKPLDEFRRLTEQVASSERWVVSGNYGDVRPVLWPVCRSARASTAWGRTRSSGRTGEPRNQTPRWAMSIR